MAMCHSSWDEYSSNEQCCEYVCPQFEIEFEFNKNIFLLVGYLKEDGFKVKGFSKYNLDKDEIDKVMDFARSIYKETIKQHDKDR